MISTYCKLVLSHVTLFCVSWVCDNQILSGQSYKRKIERHWLDQDQSRLNMCALWTDLLFVEVSSCYLSLFWHSIVYPIAKVNYFFLLNCNYSRISWVCLFVCCSVCLLLLLSFDAISCAIWMLLLCCRPYFLLFLCVKTNRSLFA